MTSACTGRRRFMKASGGAAGGGEDSRLPDMAESPDAPSLEDCALVGGQGRGGSFTFQPRPSAGRGAEIQPSGPSEAALGGDPRQRHAQQSRMQEQLAAAASAASAAAGSVQGQLAAAADSAAAQLQQALPPPGAAAGAPGAGVPRALAGAPRPSFLPPLPFCASVRRASAASVMRPGGRPVLAATSGFTTVALNACCQRQRITRCFANLE